MDIKNIIIEKAIVHILDNTVMTPVLSDFEISLDSEIQEYLEILIQKFLGDINLKNVDFQNDGNNTFKSYCLEITNNNKNFIEVSKDIATFIYDFMIKNPDIPSADLACLLFRVDGLRFLGILKLNYKSSFIHFVDQNEQGTINKIIKQKAVLPSSTQKVEEGAIINLDNLNISLIEKKYELDGIKEFYLSQHILKSNDVLSDKEKVSIINKASKTIVKKYYDGDVQKKAEIKEIISKSVEEKGTIDINEVSNKVFAGNNEMKNLYVEEIEKRGLKEKYIEVNDNIEKEISKKHRLVTDNGIEIKLPAALLNRKDKVEFLNNPDGTISIILKGINNLDDK